MKAIDFRNANFASLRSRLEGQRRAVYEAWMAHGPATTRQLAAKCGIDLLTLRPRTTELVQIGLVEVVERSEGGGQRSEHEGEYRAVERERWEQWREGQINHQMLLI